MIVVVVVAEVVGRVAAVVVGPVPVVVGVVGPKSVGRVGSGVVVGVEFGGGKHPWASKPVKESLEYLKYHFNFVVMKVVTKSRC